MTRRNALLAATAVLLGVALVELTLSIAMEMTGQGTLALAEIYRATDRLVRSVLSGPAATLERRLRGMAEPTAADIAKDRFAREWAQASTFVPRSFVDMNYVPDFRGQHVNTNDLGFRGRHRHADLIDDARTRHARGGKVVVLTGGSAAFGCYSTSDEASIVGYMNRFAVETGLDIGFANFAMGNYVASTQLTALALYGLDLDPDLVVVMDGFNDTLLAAGSGRGLKDSLAAPYLSSIYPIKPPPRPPFAGGKDPTSEAVRTAATREYARVTETLVLLAAARGAQTLLTTQPLAVASACAPSDDIMSAYQLHAGMDRLSAESQRIAKERRAAYVDLRQVFSTGEACDHVYQQWFSDIVHMNSAGQKIVAARLFSKVAAMLFGRTIDPLELEHLPESPP